MERLQVTKGQLETIYSNEVVADALQINPEEIFDIVVLEDDSALVTRSDSYSEMRVPYQNLLISFTRIEEQASKKLLTIQKPVEEGDVMELHYYSSLLSPKLEDYINGGAQVTIDQHGKVECNCSVYHKQAGSKHKSICRHIIHHFNTMAEDILA